MATEKKQELTKVESLKRIIDAPTVQEQFKNALPDNPAAFTASIIELYAGDSYLQNCDPKLVVMEALKAAILKLPIIKSLGFAYIVPFKNVPQMQIGYKGLIQLAMRTGFYRTINADVVYKGEYKSHDKLRGTFDIDGVKTSDEIVGYFAYFELSNGFSKTLFMSKERVKQHAEKYSKTFGIANGPWQKEFDAMAKKTVIRNLLSHWGMLSIEMADAVAYDSDQDVADKVAGEIKENANITNLEFDPVPETNNEQSNNKPPF